MPIDLRKFVFLKALFAVTLVFAAASIARSATDDFNFETKNFQLGRWSPKDLSYERGMTKIKTIDEWFYGLPLPDREKHFSDYKLHRNRLFLVTQEKRLLAQVQPSLRQAALGSSGTGKAFQREQSRQLAALRKMSEVLLDSPENLNRQLFVSLSDIEAALPFEFRRTERSLGSSLSNSVSKSGGDGAFGDSFSKLGRGSVGGQLSGLQALSFRQILSEVDCGQDKKCLSKIAEDRKMVLKQENQKMELVRFYAESLEKKKRDEILSRPVCKSLEVESGNLSDEFDPKKNPKTSKILNELKVSNVASDRRSNDLSSWYGEPTTQWNPGRSGPTATCVGHAIAGNVAAALYKEKLIKIPGISRSKNISPDQAYGMAKVKEDHKYGETTFEPDPSKPGYCDPSSYRADPYEGMESMIDSMAAFKTVPLCTTSQSQRTKDLFRIDKFSAAEFTSGDKKPGFAFFKAMIDSGNPPIVGVDSDARIESAGWLKITSGGLFTHVLNLVGYDEGVDPMTLCPARFFIVRDSLGKQKIHYKITAENLLAHLDGVYHASKVSEVESVDPVAKPVTNSPTAQ